MGNEWSSILAALNSLDFSPVRSLVVFYVYTIVLPLMTVGLLVRFVQLAITQANKS